MGALGNPSQAFRSGSGDEVGVANWMRACGVEIHALGKAETIVRYCEVTLGSVCLSGGVILRCGSG